MQCETYTMANQCNNIIFFLLSTDAAIFCLSLMLKESVPDGLITAVNVVKFGGPIYIVLDLTKFGLHTTLTKRVKERALFNWKEKFTKACQGLLKIQYLGEKTDGMVYIGK